MKKSILICTARSLELWCSSLPGQDQITRIPCQFFSYPARRHWTLGRRVVNYLKTIQDSVLFLSSEQGGPVTNLPNAQSCRISELLTFTDSYFASCEETSNGRCGACIFCCNSLIYMLCLRESQKQNSCKMISNLPTKLTKQSSIARILQFSVIIQVQERLPAQ